MDERPPARRPSGIPRPSRLPIAITSSLRTAASRENLSAEFCTSRLRSVASRDQLRTESPIQRTENGGATKTTQAIQRQTSPRGWPQQTRPRPSVDAVTPGRLSAVRRSGPDQEPSKRPQAFANRVAEPWPAPPISPPSSVSAASVVDSSENGPQQASELSEEALSASAAVAAATERTISSRASLSLTQRTIETLERLPSTPTLRKTASSFFNNRDEQQTAATAAAGKKVTSRPASRGSRPGSSHQSDDSGSISQQRTQSTSRPGSSSGQEENGASFKQPLGTIPGTPSRPATSTGIKSLRTPAPRSTPGGSRVVSASRLQSATAPARTPSPEKTQYPADSTPVTRTLASRPLKPRPSLTGLVKKSSNANLVSKAPATPNGASSSAPVSSDAAPASASRKSSAALREQIAKAKAAKRAAALQATQASSSEHDGVLSEAAEGVWEAPQDHGSADAELHPDPFNLNRDSKSAAAILRQRLEAARTSGKLNIAALGLKSIPPEVLGMYDLEAIGRADGSWAESVDLTRLVAADNEIEVLDDDIFPDVDLDDIAAAEEEGRGSIFGGLETLDLHGNLLVTVPMGFRRLQLLTSLNLAQNRIANHCLEIIAQITSLRDLKLGNNALSGPLDPSFSSLQNLEILDIHGNAITALPPAMDQLTRLRILNICENAFESLPFATLSRLPLTELLARKNRLTGTLIDDSVTELPSLQTLDVSCNQLQHMVSSGRTVALPALHQLAVSMNRLLELPYVGDWASLLTLTADENSISAIPDGLTKLEKLRHVDFTSNDIRVVPAEIARMENLAMLRLSGNPLRDKKFSNMNTDELKAALAARLEPLPQASPEAEAEDPVLPGASAPFPQATAGDADADQDSPSDQDDFATPPTSAPASPVRSRAHTLAGTPRSSAANQLWPVRQPGGILDRSNTQLSTLDPRVAERVAAENAVREARLSHNAFTSVPSAALSCFAATLTSLSLSHNALAGDSYLPQDPVLELPVLRDLVLASNTITSLTPLLTGLRAPHLNRLDVSFNRLTALPLGLRSPTTFPELEVLLVSNNKLTELEPEAICGLRVVDAANNDIAHLDPRLGLLDGTPGGAADVGVGRGTAGAPGLERLDVMGNRFRVPRWTVLERGTEETLRWLRGRVTVDEMAAWRAAHSGGSDGPGVSAGGGGDGSTGDGMGDRGGGERDDDGTSLADLD